MLLYQYIPFFFNVELAVYISFLTITRWMVWVTPILWPPDVKNWLTGKDSDAGKDWRQAEKGTTEYEVVGWHHWLDGHEFEQAPGVGDGQGSVPCYSPWGRKELEMTVQLNWNINPKELQYKELITARCRLSLRRYAYRSPKLTGETKTGML